MIGPWSVEQLVERRVMVMHLETLTVSRAVRLHAPGEYVSPVNDEKVDAPVLELEDGSTFVVKEDAFAPLSPREVAMAEGFADMSRTALQASLSLARSSGMSRLPAMAIARGVIRAQLAMVELEIATLMTPTIPAPSEEKGDDGARQG